MCCVSKCSEVFPAVLQKGCQHILALFEMKVAEPICFMSKWESWCLRNARKIERYNVAKFFLKYFLYFSLLTWFRKICIRCILMIHSTKRDKYWSFLVLEMIQPSGSVNFLMKWGCWGHWGHWGRRGPGKSQSHTCY